MSSLRDVHHPMWIAKLFSRLERTHIPRRENSKPHGGRNAIRGVVRSDFGDEIETRAPRAVILVCYSRSHVQPSAEGIARNR